MIIAEIKKLLDAANINYNYELRHCNEFSCIEPFDCHFIYINESPNNILISVSDDRLNIVRNGEKVCDFYNDYDFLAVSVVNELITIITDMKQ